MGKTFNIINIILLIITIIMLDIVAVNYESKIKHKSVLEQTYENMNNLDSYKIKYILNNDPNEYIYSFDTFNQFIKEEKINKKNKENNINYYIKFNNSYYYINNQIVSKEKQDIFNKLDFLKEIKVAKQDNNILTIKDNKYNIVELKIKDNYLVYVKYKIDDNIGTETYYDFNNSEVDIPVDILLKIKG